MRTDDICRRLTYGHRVEVELRRIQDSRASVATASFPGVIVELRVGSNFSLAANERGQDV